MRLLLDIGNTRLKWACWVDGALEAPGEVIHRDRPKTDAVAFLRKIPERPEKVIAANVAGKAMGDAISEAVDKSWGLVVEFAESREQVGPVRNGYEDYRQLGVDRWLAILAAYHHHRNAVCVVDAGTAITVDLVNADGTHLGGVIVPGLELMRQALNRDTGDIGRLTDNDADGGSRNDEWPGRNTTAAVRSGSLLAVCGAVERSLESLQKRCGGAALVFTGGDAGRLIPNIVSTVDHRPHLVLDGLAIQMS